MESANQANGITSTKRKHGERRLVIALVVALIVVGGVIFFGWVMPVIANGTACQAPNGYEMVTNKMVTDLSGNEIFILRGVIATGESVQGGKKIVLPPCGTTETGLATINNMFVVMDGKQVFLAAGTIGVDSNPTEVPQQ